MGSKASRPPGFSYEIGSHVGDGAQANQYDKQGRTLGERQSPDLTGTPSNQKHEAEEAQIGNPGPGDGRVEEQGAAKFNAQNHGHQEYHQQAKVATKQGVAPIDTGGRQ